MSRFAWSDGHVCRSDVHVWVTVTTLHVYIHWSLECQSLSLVFLELHLWQSIHPVTALVVAVLCGLSDVRTPVCFLSLHFLMLFLYGSACHCLDFLLDDCFALSRWTLYYWLVCLTHCMRMCVSIAMYSSI